MPLVKVSLNDMDRAIAIDPAISEKVKAARTSIICGGITPTAKIVLLDMWVGRQGDPMNVIQRTLDMARKWMVRAIGIEMIGYQKALKPFMQREMKNRGHHYPVLELKPDRNGQIVEAKNQRILSLQPFFQSGQIFIQRGMMDLITEYTNFPQGRTVDILDALAYLVRLLVPKKNLRHVPGAIQRLAQRDPRSADYWRKLAIRRQQVDPSDIPDRIGEWWEDEGEGVQEESYVGGVGELV